MAFWLGIIFLPMLWISGDTKPEALKQVPYENIELLELKVGMPWSKDFNRRSTKIGGISGKVYFDFNYDSKNRVIGKISFYVSSHSQKLKGNSDTLPIQNMIKDIEQTFNIDFLKAPKNCDIDLYAIRDSVEFDCSYSSSFFMFSMIYRPD